MSKITDKIWIGGYGNVIDNTFLNNNNLTHIISCAIELPPITPDISGSQVFRVGIIDDVVTEDTLVHFVEGARKLHAWVSSGHRVIVHCYAGMSRSVSVVIAYFIMYHKMSYKDAYTLVKTKRRQANPHPAFVPLLLNIEKYAGFPFEINVNSVTR
jgi:predicted protein tyrosine phosphatase